MKHHELVDLANQAASVASHRTTGEVLCALIKAQALREVALSLESVATAIRQGNK